MMGGGFMKSFSIIADSNVNHKMISEAIQLDRISYDDIYQLQVETCYDYFEKNSDIYIMAVDEKNGHVIGYINFSPIKETVFKDLISGNTIDTVITGDDVLPYLDGAYYWGYFSSIVVHPDYRKHGVATQMLLYWSDFVFRLATERDIYYKKIVADAVSDVGVHLLSELGFNFVKPSMHESKIMTLDLFQKNDVQSRFNEMLLAIHKEYSEKEGRSNVV